MELKMKAPIKLHRVSKDATAENTAPSRTANTGPSSVNKSPSTTYAYAKINATMYFRTMEPHM